jgi:hypothetical protein
MKTATCPFCGSKRAEVWETWHPHYTIECARCGASGPRAGSEADAIAWWNGVGKTTPLAVKRYLKRLKVAEKDGDRARYNSIEARCERVAEQQAIQDKKWADARRKWLMSPIEPEHEHG